MSRLSARDDFSKKTVELLARRAGGKCSMCACTTWGPNDKFYSATNIGQAAHITAAAEGGPRYDPSISHESRSSIKNGLWLCSNCHDNVDRNPTTFTVSYLHQLKDTAEKRARKELGVATPTTTPTQSRDSLSDIVTGVAIIEVRKLKSELTVYHTSTDQKPSLNELKLLLSKIDFINFNETFYLPELGKEVVDFLQVFSGYHDDPSLKLEVIRYLSDVTSFFPSLDVTNTCQFLKSLATGHTPRQLVYQSVFAFLKDLLLKMSKNDSNYKIIQETMETVAKQRGRRGQRQIQESVDFSGEEIASKIQRIEEDEESDVEEEKYLEKMTQLACGEGGEETEREVAQLGFEINIL